MDSIKTWQISNVTLMHGIKDYQEHIPNGKRPCIKAPDSGMQTQQYADPKHKPDVMKVRLPSDCY